MRPWGIFLVMWGALGLLPAEALAQTAFLEGHVFDKRTGVPIAGAVVRVYENVTVGPIPIELGVSDTDSNGFYEIQIGQFLGFPAIIEVACKTPRGEVRGEGSALLREGTIRRDIYLAARPRLIRCQGFQ